MRTPIQVLRRAIVMTAIACRASLEAAADTPAEGASKQILPWIGGLGLLRDLDPIEHDLLATPFKGLDRSQQIDANWSGEGANVMCWALGLTAEPAPDVYVDYTPWFDRLLILFGDALAAMHDVQLRPLEEIGAFHVRVESLRTALQLERSSPAIHPALRKVWLARLSELNLGTGTENLDRAIAEIASWSGDQKNRATGLCVVRGVASSWLIDGRPAYFQTDGDKA